MQTSRRNSSILTTGVSLVAILVVWLLLAPTQLGGQVSYVIVDGNSMETKFHLGDLVLVRKASAYQVGDAVTYQNAELGRYVFHRIVNLNVDRFVLKGDHNTWLDSYQPTTEEIIGKLWIHIPRLGKAIEWLRLPINLAIAIGLLGGSLMSNMVMHPSKNGKSKKSSTINLTGGSEVVMYAFGFLALVFLGLGILAFTRPLTRAADNILYQQDGNFFYSATGTPQVYDTDMVRSGEPVFPKLTCFLNVGFAYILTGDQLQDISGKHQLYAQVMDEQSGWQRTIPMVSETLFTGNSYLTMATLDVCQVEALVNLVKEETGLHQNIFTLKVTPHVDISAKVAGNEILDSFEPSLAFKFDEVHFYLASDSATEDPLRISKQGSVNSSSMQANILSLPGWKPSVQDARASALIGLGLTLGGSLSIGWYLYNKAQQSKSALIQLKYGALLMDIQDRLIEPMAPAIELRKIEDLVKIAERQNTMIMHMTLDLVDYYLVQANGMTYRYVVSNEKPDTREAEEPARKAVIHYMLDNSPKTIIDVEPRREVILRDPFSAKSDKAPSTEPANKVMLKYSMNVSRADPNAGPITRDLQ